MTLPRAIEILETIMKGIEQDYTREVAEALRLSIEALKRVKACRKSIDIPYDKPLPGETEE